MYYDNPKCSLSSFNFVVGNQQCSLQGIGFVEKVGFKPNTNIKRISQSFPITERVNDF